MAKVPNEIKCKWTKRKGHSGVYDCPDCGHWTANLPLYKDMVCSAKDRRRGGERRGKK